MAPTAQRASKRDVGQAGEAAAAAYLRQQGYSILAANYRCSLGEIDLIAEDGQTGELVFVEVRTRRSRAFGLPEESITPAKAQRLTHVASHFLQAEWAVGHPKRSGWRIDVIAIEALPNGEVRRFEHYRHAVERV